MFFPPRPIPPHRKRLPRSPPFTLAVESHHRCADDYRDGQGCSPDSVGFSVPDLVLRCGGGVGWLFEASVWLYPSLVPRFRWEWRVMRVRLWDAPRRRSS